MEVLGLVNLPTWLVWCLLVVLTVVLYTLYKRNTFVRLGIPTKPSAFMMGDLREMTKKGLQMYDVDQVKRYGKVYGTFWGNQPFLVISDPEMIKQIAVKHFSSFTERFRFESKMKGGKSAITFAKGKHWRFLRITLSPCFTSGKMKKMNSNMTRCLELFHGHLSKQAKENLGGFDIVPFLKAYALDVICSTGFGMDVDSQGDPDNAFVKNAQKVFDVQFQKNPVVILNLFFPDLPGLGLIEIPMFPKESFDFFKTATSTQFEDRKKLKADYGDLLQTMINAHNEECETTEYLDRRDESIEEMKRKGLTDDEVITNSFMFLLAGFETTATAMSWLVYDMAVFPDCQKKLIDEIDKEIGQEPLTYDSVFKLRYLDMVVSETLRHHPIAPVMSRKALETTEICGVTIPKGICIMFPAFALHFMPEFWEDPQKYNPERFAPENKSNLNEYAYIPFGHGPRNCIGMRLALMEVKMTIVSILQKYRIVRSEQLTVPMGGHKKGLNKPEKPVMVKLEKRN